MKKIPDILSPSDVERALKDLIPQLANIGKGANKSRRYDLLWKEKRFPPKVVVSRAVELKTRVPYPVSEFSGGEAVGQANYVLRELGFRIVPKVNLIDSPALDLELYDRYKRKQIYKLFNVDYDSQQRHLNVGLSPKLSDDGYFLFITLNKENFNEAYDYDDQLFLDTLVWTTRRNRTADRPDYVNLRDPSTRVSLFVRNNDAEDFVYAGELNYVSHSQFLDPAKNKPQQNYTWKLKFPLSNELLSELTLGVRKARGSGHNSSNKRRNPSTFAELKAAYSYALGDINTRTVIPAHYNYQVRLRNFCAEKKQVVTLEEDFVDVQLEIGNQMYIGEIKVTTNLTLAQAFRMALGQLLEYSNIRLEGTPRMIMFLDQPLDSKRLELASSLNISVVVQAGNVYTLANPSVHPALKALF